MEKKKSSWWSLLNPLAWLAAIFAPLLRWLGLLSPPSMEGFQNIQKVDVDEAAADARRTEEALDAIMNEKSAAQVVKDYAEASPEDRALMDLSALDAEGQDWLQNLSEDDLALLSMSTVGGCARSLEARAMKPLYPRTPAHEEEAEIFAIPTPVDKEEWRRQQVAVRYRQAQRELGLSTGIPTFEPKHASRPTVH